MKSDGRKKQKNLKAAEERLMEALREIERAAQGDEKSVRVTTKKRAANSIAGKPAARVKKPIRPAKTRLAVTR